MAQNENYYDQLINGWTPLDQAITRDPNSELVQLLASNGAELGSYAFPHEIEHVRIWNLRVKLYPLDEILGLKD